MSEHNIKTINMYNSGGAIEYIGHNDIDPETEKWERLFNYVEEQINKDKSKKILKFLPTQLPTQRDKKVMEN